MRRAGQNLALRNLLRRPGRSLSLAALAMLLALAVFLGTVVVRSLSGGLVSLQSRLGADIMVVPSEAASKVGLEDIVLQGSTGTFYMSRELADKIASRDGIGQISEQFYLASVSSGCCSLPVQLIGFDPETDFTIQPWVQRSTGRDLADMEVVAGSDLNAFVGDVLTFYDQKVTVAAKLERTGTNLDTAIYMNESSIRNLIRASQELGLNRYADADPAGVVSCVLINVADGYTVDDVLNDINIHVRKVKAVRTGEMIRGVTESLGGVSRVIGILAVSVWVLAAVILFIVFFQSARERTREFAVLRAIGASRRQVSHTVRLEGLFVCLAGSAAGILIGLALLPLLGKWMEGSLVLPFLLPPVWAILLIAVLSVAVTILVGAAAGSIAGRRISARETGEILREGQ